MSINEETFGNFFGCRLPTHVLDMLVVTKWPDALFTNEGENLVRDRCWWDYRGLHPALRTSLFARTYLEVREWSLPRYIGDPRDHFWLKPSDSIFNIKPQFLSGFILGRQHADTLGIEYAPYLKAIFKFGFECCGWTEQPSPMQLALVTDPMQTFVNKQWDELCKAGWRKPIHPMYRTENYAGLPAQKEWHVYVTKRVRKAGDPEINLAWLVYKDRLLPENVARRVFGAEVLTQAKERVAKFSHD